MSKLRRDDLRFLLLEGLIVLFGVLAALMVENWREGRETDRAVEAAMESLEREVERNREELLATYRIVSARRDRLLQLDSLVDGSRPFSAYDELFGGYRVPELSRSAWERASGGALANQVPADYLQDAFGLYERMSELEKLGGQITGLVFSETLHTPERARAAYGISLEIMSQQRAWARQLIEQHDAFLRRYGQAGER